jgi:hypothetical protein
VSERLADSEGPKAVLWNLHYAHLLATQFKDFVSFSE